MVEIGVFAQKSGSSPLKTFTIFTFTGSFNQFLAGTGMTFLLCKSGI